MEEALDGQLCEEGSPPCEVVSSLARWGMWHERAVTEYPEEGLQVGEVSSSLRDSVNGLHDGRERKDFTFRYDLACM